MTKDQICHDLTLALAISRLLALLLATSYPSFASTRKSAKRPSSPSST